MKYDLEIKKINIGVYEDIGSMSASEFNKRLQEAEDIDNDLYFLEKQLKNI